MCRVNIAPFLLIVFSLSLYLKKAQKIDFLNKYAILSPKNHNPRSVVTKCDAKIYALFPQFFQRQKSRILNCYHLLCRCMEYDFNHKINLRECHNLKLLIKAMRYSWSEQLQNLLCGMRLSVRLFGCRDMAVSMSLLLQKISHIVLRPILTSWPSMACAQNV